MSREEIMEKIVEMLVDQLGVSEDEIEDNADFAGDLGADSLDLVELIMSMEEEFDLDIPDEDVENITSVGDAVDYVAENI
ncbi:MAG: acyl carrier protein [Clostridia bacterium]